MKVTKVVVHKMFDNCAFQALCSVVVDDCLKLSDILLCKNEKGYFLIFPSKQDVYKEINSLNEGVSIKYPVNRRDKYNEGSKKYEEFFYPVSHSFYTFIRDCIIDAYNRCKETGDTKILFD
jgi:DNA-binding cell septation regulator SpoVG